MSAVPETARELSSAARDLGYGYSHASGGHLFYVKANPDKRFGQSAKLCIPTDVKSEKTRRNILKGMGFFKANNLDHAGHPIAEEKPDPAEEQKKLQAHFNRDLREWKSQMKRYTRGIVKYPGHAPAVPPAPKP